MADNFSPLPSPSDAIAYVSGTAVNTTTLFPGQLYASAFSCTDATVKTFTVVTLGGHTVTFNVSAGQPPVYLKYTSILSSSTANGVIFQ